MSEIVVEDALLGGDDLPPAHPAERALLAGVASARRRSALAAGRRAGHRALAALLGRAEGLAILPAPSGAPVVIGCPDPPAISLSHGRVRALAAAGFVARLGIDLCDAAEEPRLRALAARFLPAERPLLADAWSHRACWAAKEAALKALGLGLLDGGLFGPGPAAVRVRSLDPPRLDPPWLALRLWELPEGTAALVWQHG